MDIPAVTTLALLCAVAALALALYAISTARRSATALADTAAAGAAARKEVAELAARVVVLERGLLEAGAEQRLVTDRAAGAESRLTAVEAKLREIAQAASPPPMPSGRRAAQLEDLRATLRAQAAEAAAEANANVLPEEDA